MNTGKTRSLLLQTLLAGLIFTLSCKKHDNIVPGNTTDLIKIDSIVPDKRNLLVWEQCSVRVHARGEKLKYKWETDHGSMLGLDSVTVVYWGCPSCIGTNTIKCTVSNEHGSVSDTVMVRVKK